MKISRAGFLIFSVVTLWLAAGLPLLAQSSAQWKKLKSEGEVRVAFVGCGSDGQLGPKPAPTGTAQPVRIPSNLAAKLAFYTMKDGPSVLAPRGWHCFGTYGSNGESIFVSPNPIDAKQLLSPEWKGFTGPAIQVSYEIGDTSGRFSVAKMIARVFPDRKQFVNDVIAEDIEPAADFPFGPYPSDKLTPISKEQIEYQTPPYAEGLGTHSRLIANNHPISGLVGLIGDTPDLMMLAMRLPPEDQELAPAIIRYVEANAAAKSLKIELRKNYHPNDD